MYFCICHPNETILLNIPEISINLLTEISLVKCSFYIRIFQIMELQCKKKLDNLFLVLHTNILVSQSGPTYLPGMMRSSNCLLSFKRKERMC